MKREDAEEFTQSLGQIVGGSYRMLLHARQQKIHKALGYSKFSDWVNERLGGYVKYSVEQRLDKVLELQREGYSNRAIADALGVHERTIRNAENSADQEADDSRINGLQKADAENSALLNPFSVLAPSDEPPSDTATKRKANEDKRKAILDTPADPVMPEGLHIGDFFELAESIEDESVDLVFTDPPYDKESVDLYRKAAKVAARILKAGGSFVAYTGQKYLPEVYAHIGNRPELVYWWTFAGVHAEGKQMLQKLGVRCGWKPLVWYVKGTRGNVSEVLADVVTGAREKSHHEWQQSEAEALHFIEKLCPSGGLVVDFFLGGGTTAVAAKTLGRRWIGFEVDAKAAKKAAERISAQRS